MSSAYNMRLPEKIELANRMLAWLKEKGISEGPNPQAVIKEFAEHEQIEVYKAYRAWELLYQMGRRVKSQGGHNWKLTSFAAISFVPEGASFEVRLKKLEKEVSRLCKVLLKTSKLILEIPGLEEKENKEVEHGKVES